MKRFRLGDHSRRITTTSPEAQAWFDLGLNWCFAFNHEEGVKCFRQALASDPGCVMADWGVAFGSGPFYNHPWRHFGTAESEARTRLCHNHIERARHSAREATEIESVVTGTFDTTHAVGSGFGYLVQGSNECRCFTVEFDVPSG